jgi:hypothetical protein
MCGCSKMNKLFCPHVLYELNTNKPELQQVSATCTISTKLKTCNIVLLFIYFNNLKTSDRITELNTVGEVNTCSLLKSTTNNLM